MTDRRKPIGNLAPMLQEDFRLSPSLLKLHQPVVITTAASTGLENGSLMLQAIRRSFDTDSILTQFLFTQEPVVCVKPSSLRCIYILYFYALLTLLSLLSDTIAGRVMGLSNNLRIDYEKTRAIGNKGIVMRQGGKGPKSARYSDPNATWRDQSQEYKRISRANAEELALKLNLAQEDPSYISLDIRSGPKMRRSLHDSEDESEEEDYDDRKDGGSFNPRKTANYRDIHGKSVYKEEDEDLLQTTSDQEEEGAESALDVLMRRRMMLDGDLRKV